VIILKASALYLQNEKNRKVFNFLGYCLDCCSILKRVYPAPKIGGRFFWRGELAGVEYYNSAFLIYLRYLASRNLCSVTLWVREIRFSPGLRWGSLRRFDITPSLLVRVISLPAPAWGALFWVRGNLLQDLGRVDYWFKSYLSSRSLRVRCSGSLSSPHDSLSMVYLKALFLALYYSPILTLSFHLIP